MSESKDDKKFKEEDDGIIKRIDEITDILDVKVSPWQVFDWFETIIFLNEYMENKINFKLNTNKTSAYLKDLKTIRKLKLASFKLIEEINLIIPNIDQVYSDVERSIDNLNSRLKEEIQMFGYERKTEIERFKKLIDLRSKSLKYLEELRSIDVIPLRLEKFLKNTIKFQENLNHLMDVNQMEDVDQSVDISQKNVLYKLGEYLKIKKEINTEDLEIHIQENIEKGVDPKTAEKKAQIELGMYSQSFIDGLLNLFKKGQCNGLSILWSIAMLNHEEEDFISALKKIVLHLEDFEKKIFLEQGGEKKIDYDIIREILKEIIRTDDKFQLFIDKTIQHIRWFQDELNRIWASQQNVDLAYNIVSPNKKSLKEVFSFGYLFTEKELERTLNDCLRPNQIFYLSGEMHTMGIFSREYEGKKIYYAYDPNESKGYLTFNSISDLRSYLKFSLFERFNLKTEFMPVMFNVFSFSNKENVYKNINSKELLINLLREDNHALKRRGGYENKDLIIFLIESGCIELLQELLDRNLFKINDLLMYSGQMTTALQLAIKANQSNMVLFLLRHGAIVQNTAHSLNFIGDPASLFRKYFPINLETAVQTKNLTAIEILSRLGYDSKTSKELLLSVLKKTVPDKDIYTLLLTNPNLDKLDPEIILAMAHAEKTLSQLEQKETKSTKTLNLNTDSPPPIPPPILLSSSLKHPPQDLVYKINKIWNTENTSQTQKEIEIRKLFPNLNPQIKITNVREHRIQYEINGIKKWDQILEFFNQDTHFKKNKMDNPEEYKRHRDQDPSGGRV